jgi:hypothetical protein
VSAINLEDLESDPFNMAVVIRFLASRPTQRIRRIEVPMPSVPMDVDIMDVPQFARWFLQGLYQEIQRFTELRSLCIGLPSNVEIAEEIALTLVTPRRCSFAGFWWILQTKL